MQLMSLLVFVTLLAVNNHWAGAQSTTPSCDVHGHPLPKGAVARLGTVKFQLPSYLRAVALSPDSRLVASSQITEMQGIRPSYGFAR